MKLIKEKKKNFYKEKLKKKHWQTKGIVESSINFTLAL